jgi:hypothetical protein
MISVIICSIQPELLSDLEKNVSQTIGVPFEILHIDNRTYKKGICQVYNELAAKARFPYVCFLHEDIILKTQNWGKNIENIFVEDADIALIGIAGCKYKSAYFSGWFSNVKELDCANYIHQYKNRIENVYLAPEKSSDEEEVVCVDGVFICCLKEAWQNIMFNDSLLKGFHFYDIDFSLRVSQHYKIVVTYDINLVHITGGGDYGNAWIDTAILYHQSMKSLLPFSKIKVDKKHADRKLIIATLDFLKNYRISFVNKIRWIFLQNLYLFPRYYYSILKFMLYKPLRMNFIHRLLKNNNLTS